MAPVRSAAGLKADPAPFLTEGLHSRDRAETFDPGVGSGDPRRARQWSERIEEVERRNATAAAQAETTVPTPPENRLNNVAIGCYTVDVFRRSNA
jgi:hypothetical protein